MKRLYSSEHLSQILAKDMGFTEDGLDINLEWVIRFNPEDNYIKIEVSDDSSTKSPKK